MYHPSLQHLASRLPAPELPISLLSSSADGRLNAHGAHRRTPLPTAEPKPLTRYRSHVVRCLADQDSSSPQNTIAHLFILSAYRGSCRTRRKIILHQIDHELKKSEEGTD
ncbi:hypothetical protein LXL04_007386 [Taraxacum kok-saghyz]